MERDEYKKHLDILASAIMPGVIGYVLDYEWTLGEAVEYAVSVAKLVMLEADRQAEQDEKNGKG